MRRIKGTDDELGEDPADPSIDACWMINIDVLIFIATETGALHSNLILFILKRQ